MRLPLFSRLFAKKDASSGFSTMSQIVGTGNPIYGRRDYAFLTKEAFEKNPTVFKSVMLVAQSCAGIGWKLYQQSDRQREIDDHPLLTLFQNPNPLHGTGSFFEEAVAYWVLTGNSYILAVTPSPRAQPTELWALRPDRISILPAQTGGVSQYEYTVDGKITLFDAPNMLHMKMFAANDDWYGFSPVLVAGNLIDQQNNGFDWNTALIQNAGRPSGALIAQGVLGEDQYERLRTMIRDRYTGKRNAGLPLLLEGGIDWKPFSMSPYELDWLESRKSNARDISLVLGVPPELIGDSSNKTYSNYGEARLSFYQETVLPLMDRLRDYLNYWIIPLFDPQKQLYLDYDKEGIEALQEDRNNISQRVISEWGAGVMTLNEARMALGLDEMPGGDFLQLTSQGKVYVPMKNLEQSIQSLLELTISPPQPQAPAAPQKGETEQGQEGDQDTAGNDKEQADANDQSQNEDQGSDDNEEEQPTPPVAKKSGKLSTYDRYRRTQQVLKRKYVASLVSWYEQEKKLLLRSAHKAAIPQTIPYRLEAALSSSLPEFRKMLTNLAYATSMTAGDFIAAELGFDEYDDSWYPGDQLAKRIEQIVSWYSDRQLKKIQQCLTACDQEDGCLEHCIDTIYDDHKMLQTLATSETMYLMNMAASSVSTLYVEVRQVPLQKIWNTQRDGHVRESHVKAEGQAKDINQPFEIEGQLLSYPGDESLNASPDMTMNCRCFLIVSPAPKSIVLPDGNLNQLYLEERARAYRTKSTTKYRKFIAQSIR